MNLQNGPTVAVHVAATPDTATAFEESARQRGASVISLPLGGLRTRKDLSDQLARVFMFPQEHDGLDSALDWLSDLSWFGNDDGYLIVIEEAERATPKVVADLMGILPATADRWRSQGIGFVAVLVGVAHHVTALEALARANAALRAFGELAWPSDTREVEVIDHAGAESPPA